MAKFRTYKNGIFGHRYKGYYILRNNANQCRKGKLYRVIDENKNLILDDTEDYFDCEWYIDKLKASDEEMKIYETLYKCDIPQLQRLCASYSSKAEEKTITKEENILYLMTLKIRDRKIADKEF